MRADAIKTTLFLALIAVAGLALTGCCQVPCDPCGGMAEAGACASLPPDLPSDPEACTSYCRVWVPPEYRKVPKLVCLKPAHMETKQGTVCKTRFRDVCTKPAITRKCRTADKVCDKTAVQVTPGGYKWKPDPCKPGCWKYCYVPPNYTWCNRVETDKGIEYCTEIPPEYHVEAYTEEVPVCSQEYVPAEYGVKYVNECYRPGYWAWQPKKDCPKCECPDSVCTTIRRQPCSPVRMSGGTSVHRTVPRTN